MKVIFTDQCSESLSETIEFLIGELGWSQEKISKLISKLLDKAEELEYSYNHYHKKNICLTWVWDIGGML